jgi:hypothetical protein
MLQSGDSPFRPRSLFLEELKLNTIGENESDESEKQPRAITNKSRDNVGPSNIQVVITGACNDVSYVGKHCDRSTAVNDRQNLQTFNRDSDEAFIGLLQMPIHCTRRWLCGLHDQVCASSINSIRARIDTSKAPVGSRTRQRAR